MKIISNLLLVAVLVSISVVASAIEESEKIKVTPILKIQESWDGKQIVYPEGKAEVTGMIVEIAPGAETGWHLHSVPSFGMVLEGELQVEFKNGDIKYLKAGESAAEAVNVLHNGRNVGKVPIKLVVFYVGTTEAKLTVKEATGK
jgi:quercetin dioxygenase-like cupin family protein